MRLSASNIGWSTAEDERVWEKMKQLGYTGLEIAPTRVFPERPYDNLPGAALFAGVMWQKYGFSIPSMQSIWYGWTGRASPSIWTWGPWWPAVRRRRTWPPICTG